MRVIYRSDRTHTHLVSAQVLDGARQQCLTASRIRYVRNGSLEFGLRFGALLLIEICVRET